MAKYEKGSLVTGYVTGIEKYGIFVNLDEYYNGLIHISEISPNFVRDVNDYVNVGETIKMKIVDINEKNHHVKLSIKNVDYRINNRKKQKIKETVHGFSTLEKRLEDWVNKKYDELTNNDF